MSLEAGHELSHYEILEKRCSGCEVIILGDL
jgi:hypothetical protein